VANWFQRLLHTKSTSVRRLRSNTWQNSSSLRVEALEDRITPVRIGAGWLPRATAALAGPDLASAHLDSALLNLIQPTTSTAATESDLRPEAPKDRMLFDNTGRVEVDIAAVDVRRLWPSLEALGFQETATCWRATCRSRRS
jgi:hypothetical protein